MVSLSNRSKPKIALIGCGHFGLYHCRNIVGLSALCELVGIYDRTPEKAAAVSKELDLPLFNDLGELLSAEIDAIDIVTSTSSHYEIAREFIAKKVHVFLEKPITESHPRSKELVELAIANQVILKVGFIERYGSYLPEIVALSKGVRDLEIIRTTEGSRKGNEDVINDLMIHDLDLLLNYCFPGIIPEIKDIAVLNSGELYRVGLSFNGATVLLTAGKAAANVSRTYTFKGSFNGSVDLSSNQVTLFDPTGNQTRKLDDVNKLYAELKRFITDVSEARIPDESLLRGYLSSSELVERIKSWNVDRRS